MARYRKIDVRIWGDERFRRLSDPPPCGQFLWFFLLTNPETTNVPGLYREGRAAMAETLNWPIDGFSAAFRELSDQGLVKADWQARVVWVPNVIKYNRPENPNVVTSWRVTWDEIPECPLKAEAYDSLATFLAGIGQPFLKAFEEACRNPLGKPSPKASANQEQEQEQNQEQNQKSESFRRARRAKKVDSSGRSWLPIARVWRDHLGGELPESAKGTLKPLIEQYGIEVVASHLGNYLESMRGQAQFISLRKFASTFGTWEHAHARREHAPTTAGERGADAVRQLLEETEGK